MLLDKIHAKQVSRCKRLIFITLKHSVLQSMKLSMETVWLICVCELHPLQILGASYPSN